MDASVPLYTYANRPASNREAAIGDGREPIIKREAAIVSQAFYQTKNIIRPGRVGLVLGHDFNPWGMETGRGSTLPLRRFVCVDANHEVGPRGRPCAREKKRGGAACLRAASANPLTGRRLVSRLGGGV